MVIMSVVRAIDAAEERGQRLGFGFAGENLAEVVAVLGYVEGTDGKEVIYWLRGRSTYPNHKTRHPYHQNPTELNK